MISHVHCGVQRVDLEAFRKLRLQEMQDEARKKAQLQRKGYGMLTSIPEAALLVGCLVLLWVLLWDHAALCEGACFV